MNDDTAPATKGDIRHLDGRIDKLDGRMSNVEGSVQRLDARVDKVESAINGLRNEMREMGKGLHDAIDQVLTVLVNVDKRLTASVVDHEKRINRLEQSADLAA